MAEIFKRNKPAKALLKIMKVYVDGGTEVAIN